MKYIVELWKCETYEFDDEEDGYHYNINDVLEQAFNLVDDDGDSFMDPVDKAIVWGIEEDGTAIKLKET